MNVTVRLFGGLRRTAGRSEVTLHMDDGARLLDVVGALSDVLDDFEAGECVFALNREYAAPGQPLRDGDEVALVPPVSGGADVVRRIRLTAEPLRADALTACVGDRRAGAIVVFHGVTRDVPRLEYEAYAEMAEPRMRAIAEQEAERHDLVGVAVEHRVGSVPLGEPSVVVAVAAAHRGEAFDGARAIIDRIKAEAPLWKEEETPDGMRAVPGTLPPVPRDTAPAATGRGTAP
jgi:MoaE-MoaD fusion protein